jgi:hypothetical protein
MICRRSCRMEKEAFDRCVDDFVGLRAGDDVRFFERLIGSADHNRRYRGDAEASRVTFILDDPLTADSLFQRRTHRLTVQSHRRSYRDERVEMIDVPAILEKGFKKCAMDLVESPFRPCEFSEFEGPAATRLHRGQPEHHAPLPCHRIDGLIPHGVQILAIGIERWYGRRAKFERTPLKMKHFTIFLTNAVQHRFF